MPLMAWQEYAKYRPLWRILSYLDPSSMCQRYLACEAKADARTLGLGGEEGHEYLLLPLLRHAWSIIGHGKHSAVLILATAYGDGRAFNSCHCIHGIVEKINRGLAQQIRISV